MIHYVARRFVVSISARGEVVRAVSCRFASMQAVKLLLEDAIYRGVQPFELFTRHVGACSFEERFPLPRAQAGARGPAVGAEARSGRGSVHVQGAADGPLDAHGQLPQAPWHQRLSRKPSNVLKPGQTRNNSVRRCFALLFRSLSVSCVPFGCPGCACFHSCVPRLGRGLRGVWLAFLKTPALGSEKRRFVCFGRPAGTGGVE